jgi:hypothetical protein
MIEQPAREDGDGDVRRVMTAVTRDASRQNGTELEATVLIGTDATEARKVAASRPSRVRRVVVDTVAIRLPQLDHGVRNADTVAIEHVAVDFDALTLSILPGKRIAARACTEETIVKERTDGLGRGQRA